MARYKVEILVDGNNINTVRKQIAVAFPGQETSVDKINLSPSRADRMADAVSQIEDAKSTLEELRDELQEWHNNLPDNFQQGDKGSQLEQAVSDLETIISSLDEATGTDVEFPSMMG